MITKFLLIGAVGALFVSGTRAEPNLIDRTYLASVSAQADARLANAGVELPGPLRVTGEVNGERVSDVRFASTGDLGADRAVDQTLHNMPIAQVPADLAGRTVSLTLSPAPSVQADFR